jgi:hypothetical protein
MAGNDSSNSKIRCFWLEPTDQVELSLRRYRGSEHSKCAVSGFGYHNASAIVERASIAQLAARGWPMENDRPAYTIDVGRMRRRGKAIQPSSGESRTRTISLEDPRWPRTCSCGYQFAEDDAWQCNPFPLFRRLDNGELVTLQAAPVGAMWNAAWLERPGPDGICLMVRTPGGEWPVDGPSYHGGKIRKERGWKRSGAIPDVTASPSIMIPGKYFGFLRSGWLESL